MTADDNTFSAKYTYDTTFHEFLDREFDLVAREATLEELAEFAFGSVEEAIEAYERRKEGLHESHPIEDDHETT